MSATAALPSPRRPGTDPVAYATDEPLRLPPSSLVVIAGLPGAGKTTMLRRVAGTAGVHALDAEDVRRRLGRVPVPYAVLRPFVHAGHLANVCRTVNAPYACVLTSDPMTSAARRGLLRLAARASGRRLYVVLIDASPAEAREGQRRRGRALGRRRMARHERRYERLARRGPGAVADVVLDRTRAALVDVVCDR